MPTPEELLQMKLDLDQFKAQLVHYQALFQKDFFVDTKEQKEINRLLKQIGTLEQHLAQANPKTIARLFGRELALPFCPRRVQLVVGNTPQKPLYLDSAIVPPYEVNLSLPAVEKGTKVAVKFLGSPYNDQAVKAFSLSDLYNKAPSQKGFSLKLVLKWNHGEKYLHDTAQLKDGAQLSRDYYGDLRKGVEQLDAQLACFYQKGAAYFDAIAKAYKDALESFRTAAEVQTNYDVQTNKIYNSVLSVAWVGSFSWVSGLTQLAAVYKPIGVTSINKVTALQHSVSISQAPKRFQDLESVLYAGAAIQNGAFSISNIGTAIAAINDQLLEVTANIDEAIRDINAYCTPETLPEHQQRYERLSQAIVKFLNKKTNLLVQYQRYFKTIDENKLRDEIERTMWAHWIKGLVQYQPERKKESQMGPWAGRTPNYPPKYETHIEPNADYKTDLHEAVVARLKALDIATLQESMFGGIPVPAIAKLITWARQHLSNPSFSV